MPCMFSRKQVNVISAGIGRGAVRRADHAEVWRGQDAESSNIIHERAGAGAGGPCGGVTFGGG